LQRGQRPQLFHPPFLRRSSAHSLFWISNHEKNLILGGAQTFQIILLKIVQVAPNKWAS
jgi:hypothetical protein